MARSRTIRPSFWTSFTLGSVSRDARLLFAGLWTEADDEGRMIDSPKALAGAVFPHDEDVDPADVRRWLDELAAVDAVRRYETKGASYLFIPRWDDYQKPPHPTPSRLPNPPGKRRSNSRKPPEDSAKSKEKGRTGLGSGFGLGSGSLKPSSSTSDSRPPGQPVDDDDRLRLETETLDLLGKRHLADRMRSEVVARQGPVGDVVAWQAADRGKTLERHGERLKALTAGSAAELAELLEPTPRATTVTPPPFEPSEVRNLPPAEQVRPNLDQARAALKPAVNG